MNKIAAFQLAIHDIEKMRQRYAFDANLCARLGLGEEDPYLTRQKKEYDSRCKAIAILEKEIQKETEKGETIAMSLDVTSPS